MSEIEKYNAKEEKRRKDWADFVTNNKDEILLKCGKEPEGILGTNAHFNCVWDLYKPSLLASAKRLFS